MVREWGEGEGGLGRGRRGMVCPRLKGQGGWGWVGVSEAVNAVGEVERRWEF